MNINDLFVSYKQTDPVVFERRELNSPQPIYLNLKRAQDVTSSNSEQELDQKQETTDYSTWEVNNYRKPDSIQQNINSTETNSTNNMDQISSNSNTGLNYNGKHKQWIQMMTDAYRRLGLSDNAIKNVLAKNSLESNWGRAITGNHNYGGITVGSTWKGDFVIRTDEDKNKNPVKRRFRSYKTLDDFVKDEINMLKRLYDFDQKDNIDTFLHKLQGGAKKGYSYAEAPQYKDAVRDIYKQL